MGPDDSLKLTAGALLTRLVTQPQTGSPKQDRVLDAAYAAFLDFGVRRTSMAEIARRAGVSSTTLYRWFASKNDLVLAVILRECQRFVGGLEADIDRDAPGDAQLIEVATRLVRRLQDRALLDRLLKTDPDVILPELTVNAAPLLEVGTAYLTMHLQRLVDDGRVGPLEPAYIAELLTRVVQSLLLTPSTRLPFDDEDRIRAVLSDIIRRLLRVEPPAGAAP